MDKPNDDLGASNNEMSFRIDKQSGETWESLRQSFNSDPETPGVPPCPSGRRPKVRAAPARVFPSLNHLRVTCPDDAAMTPLVCHEITRFGCEGCVTQKGREMACPERSSTTGPTL
jgi:hypothetical protein